MIKLLTSGVSITVKPGNAEGLYHRISKLGGQIQKADSQFCNAAREDFLFAYVSAVFTNPALKP